MGNELITLTQSPVIEYTAVDRISEEVKVRLDKLNLAHLLPTEDNKQELKKIRTDLTKEFADYESARILIKKSVNAPYDKFEEAYKEKITKQFKDADKLLKEAVDKIDNEIKEETRQKVLDYFNELISFHNIDFVSFEQVGLNITLNATLKSLKDQTRSFIERIANDLVLIETQSNKERILIRYKQNLNVSQSITSITNEIKQEQELIRRAEEREVMLESVRPQPVVERILEAPKQVIVEELMSSTFTVTGTKRQLIAVREFMKKEGIKYE